MSAYTSDSQKHSWQVLLLTQTPCSDMYSQNVLTFEGRRQHSSTWVLKLVWRFSSPVNIMLSWQMRSGVATAGPIQSCIIVVSQSSLREVVRISRHLWKITLVVLKYWQEKRYGSLQPGHVPTSALTIAWTSSNDQQTFLMAVPWHRNISYCEPILSNLDFDRGFCEFGIEAQSTSYRQKDHEQTEGEETEVGVQS